MKVNIPGFGPFAVGLPIAHSDHPPPPELEEFVDSHPATKWNEHWAGIDLEAAERATSSFIESFNYLRRFPVL